MPKQNKSKKYVGITVDKTILREIDRSRGLIKRSTFVNQLLKMLLQDCTHRPTAKGSALPIVSPASENRIDP